MRGELSGLDNEAALVAFGRIARDTLRCSLSESDHVRLACRMLHQRVALGEETIAGRALGQEMIELAAISERAEGGADKSPAWLGSRVSDHPVLSSTSEQKCGRKTRSGRCVRLLLCPLNRRGKLSQHRGWFRNAE